MTDHLNRNENNNIFYISEIFEEISKLNRHINIYHMLNVSHNLNNKLASCKNIKSFC